MSSKKKILIIVAVLLVLAAAAIAAAVIVPRVRNNSGRSSDPSETQEKKDESILSCLTKQDIEEYIAKQQDPDYYTETDYYYFPDAEVWGNMSVAELLLDGEQILLIVDRIDVLLPDGVHAYDETSNDDSEGEEHDHDHDHEDHSDSESFVDSTEEPKSEAFDFTETEKQQIETVFQSIIHSFCEYVGCGEFSTPDLIPARFPTEGEQIPEDVSEAFYLGFYVREYSVRDVKGVLWILRTEASYGSASATIMKVLDETGYDGFMPAIDMTKTYG